MIHCRILTPAGLARECDTAILNVVTLAGQMGILPRHVPVVTILAIAKMALEEPGGREIYTIGGGMLYFKEDQATILVNSLENVKDLDFDRAQRAKERAENRMRNPAPDMDWARAEAALKRACNRLSAR